MIKALVAGKKRFLEPKVPFSDAGGLVAVVLEQFGYGQFIGMNPGWRIRPVDPDFIAHASRIATSQQARPGRTANRCGGIIVRETDTVLRHGINMRGLHFSRSITSKIVVSLIIN